MQWQTDPYTTLGISRHATVDQIKQAYRRAALRWHPDVSRADRAEAERRFREIHEAYKKALRAALLAQRAARQSRGSPGGFQAVAARARAAHPYVRPQPTRYRDPGPRRRRAVRRFRGVSADLRLSLLGAAWLIFGALVIAAALGTVSVLQWQEPREALDAHERLPSDLRALVVVWFPAGILYLALRLRPGRSAGTNSVTVAISCAMILLGGLANRLALAETGTEREERAAGMALVTFLVTAGVLGWLCLLLLSLRGLRKSG